ncbi:MAG: PhnD/SsuA/transferrin family substrate-binding protein [Pelagimonas sp.]|jgi:ribosomal protein S9|nr:PhnD/SsuA/transferrin family substrate-binding protein [Pelagimonas sp.]
MIAAMPMYDRPEMQAANDAFWRAIRAELQTACQAGPDHLTRGPDLWDIWESPDLWFAQTCSLPYRMRLHDQVQLLGCFDHQLPGCAPGFYNSVLIARANDDRSLGDLLRARVAINQRHSQSGFAALFETAQTANVAVQVSLETGSHLASAQAVAGGHADLVALDALSWQFMKRYDAFAQDLREVTRSQPTPALPLVCAKTAPAEQIRFAVGRAVAGLDPALKDTLCVYKMVQHPQSAYTSLPIWADFTAI